MERVHTEGGVDPRLDTDAFAVRFDENSVLYLEDLYRDTTNASDLAKEAHIAHFVTTTMSSIDWPCDWNEALPRLRPILKPSTYTIDSGSGLLLSRRVFPLIDELVVIDKAAHRTAVSWQTIETWGIDPATVFAAARSNLATITQHADPTKGRAVQRLVDAGGDPHPQAANRDGNRYVTSWLLDPGWLASHRARFGCPPVAFIPDDQTVHVLPGDDDELLDQHFERAEAQYARTSRALSPQAYTVDDNGAVITFDQTHPDHSGAARARCIHIIREYAAQGDWLRRQYHLEGIGTEVGTVTVKATAFGPRTVTIWSETADCALPVADLVAFTDDRSPPFYVQFADVASITGIRAADGLDPARFQVSAWPTSHIIDELRAHSLPVD